MSTLSTGDYVIHSMHAGHASLVRLATKYPQDDGPARWAIDYVQVCYDGDVCGGGGSSAWPEEQFHPIVNPLDFCAARAHQAMKAINAAKALIVQEQREYDANVAAVKALQAATKNAAAASPREPKP